MKTPIESRHEDSETFTFLITDPTGPVSGAKLFSGAVDVAKNDNYDATERWIYARGRPGGSEACRQKSYPIFCRFTHMLDRLRLLTLLPCPDFPGYFPSQSHTAVARSWPGDPRYPVRSSLR